jgi:hypothetical protein
MYWQMCFSLSQHMDALMCSLFVILRLCIHPTSIFSQKSGLLLLTTEIPYQHLSKSFLNSVQPSPVRVLNLRPTVLFVVDPSQYPSPIRTHALCWSLSFRMSHNLKMEYSFRCALSVLLHRTPVSRKLSAYAFPGTHGQCDGEIVTFACSSKTASTLELFAQAARQSRSKC